MPRFRLLVEYVGTRYRGWQVQPNATTIAGELGRAIEDVTRRDRFELYGSGRTDAGVHALQQVAHLDVATGLSAEQLCARINDRLPHDIAVVRIEVASHRFHARRDVVRRSYLYQISTRPVAFAKALTWWVKEPLDPTVMQQAAAYLVGLHDFRAFTDSAPEEQSTRVLIEQLHVHASPPFILIRIVGSHFLWKMVRRITGVLVEVGRGRLAASVVPTLLDVDSPVPARLTAPASGLFLERVQYKGDTGMRPLIPVLSL